MAPDLVERATVKSIETVLTEALGEGWREISPGVYLAPPGTPCPAIKREPAEPDPSTLTLEDLI